MTFEIYKPRGERAPKLPLVKISKNSMVFNKYAREKLKATKVELAFDPKSHVIRVKASDEGQNIKKTKVFVRGFLNRFGIVAKGKFRAEYDEKEQALYVNIENAIKVPQ